MKVSEVMIRDVRLIEPAQTIHDAARPKAELDAGISQPGGQHSQTGGPRA